MVTIKCKEAISTQGKWLSSKKKKPHEETVNGAVALYVNICTAHKNTEHLLRLTDMGRMKGILVSFKKLQCWK